MVVVQDVKAPNLAFEMTLHDHSRFLIRLNVLNFDDCAISQTHKHVALEKVDRDSVFHWQVLRYVKRAKINELFKFENSAGSNRNQSNLAILGARYQLLTVSGDRGHWHRVRFDRSLDFALEAPHLNVAILAASVAPALLVKGNAQK